jgi:hypothetical protein
MKTLQGIFALLLLPAPALTNEGMLSSRTRLQLQRWYEGVGAPLARESFGAYLARAAFHQRGLPYETVQEPKLPERLRVELSRFECVTFIESSLAVARCGFRGEPTASCFEREIVAWRYRGGALGDYASRLHYFDDWIDDNEQRRRLANLTAELGGEPVSRPYFHISARVLPRSHLSSEALATLLPEVKAMESRLSLASHPVLSRDKAPPILDGLEDGDVVAFVRERTGLLIHHAGIVYRVGGRTKLLHASSYHGRVVLTRENLSSYLLRRSDRRGVLVARPLSP